MSWTFSDFLRRSGAVLASLGRADVALKRRDGDDVVLTTAARYEAVRDAVRLTASLPDVPPWMRGLDGTERSLHLRAVSEGLLTWAELGSTGPLERALSAIRERCRERADRRASWRPVAVPDLEEGSAVPSGIVELPLHIRWSNPGRVYDLSDRRDLRRVYEQVLREGTESDVRRFIDPRLLAELWDELVLPERVRRAWEARVRRAQ